VEITSARRSKSGSAAAQFDDALKTAEMRRPDKSFPRIVKPAWDIPAVITAEYAPGLFR
jgi:hypothetical protein